jgi:hypothetical protein
VRRLLKALFGRGPRRSTELEPADLWRATSTDGATSRSGRRPVTIRHRSLATVDLRSGRLVACDPAVSAGDARPFTRATPAGRFPVELRIAEYEDGDQRVASALVRFTDREPSAWEVALPEGLDDDWYAYSVDSGNGCFASPEALRGLAGGSAEDALGERLDETYVDTWSWADAACGPDGENVVAFASGWGDGAYPTYWGLDASREPAVALTDFLVLDAE